MDKRFIAAIALVFLVLILSSVLFGPKQKSTERADTGTSTRNAESQPRESSEESEEVIPESEVPAEVLKEMIVPVQTPLYKVELTTNGARAVSWKLKNYPRRSKKLIFSVASEYSIDLNKGKLSRSLRQKFADENQRQRFENNSILLSQRSTVLVKKVGSDWLITDEDSGKTYSVKLIKSRDGSMSKLDISYEQDNPEFVDLIPLDTRREDGKWLAIKFLDPEIQDEMEDAQWSLDSGRESLEIRDVFGAQDSLTFSHTTSKGIRISKKMTFFPDDYWMDMDIVIDNQSPEEKTLGGYRLYWGPGIAKDAMIKDMELAKEGPMALVSTEEGLELKHHWYRTGFACYGKNTRVPDGYEQGGPISWVGFAGKYFAAAIIPGPDPWWSDPGNRVPRYAVETSPGDTVLPLTLPPTAIWNEWGGHTAVALVRPEFSLFPGEAVSHTFRVYVGPKKWDILRSVKGRDSVTEEPLGLGKMIDFGRFSPLGKATLWLLKTFYRVTHNYGVSLIFLTILIKILYFPLTQKSFKSMRKMQRLQPKIADLKEKHRDDPQRLQKETMKLYKQNKVNPMGGCLPLLFQLPVFWALFATLRGAVELRGAVFIPGWVNDLSLQDTVARIGPLPINILPLLMTGTMLLQQFLFTPSGQGGQSNKMMAFMPLIFAFIFYSMPSGLVLYWLCNNVLAIGHQYMIRRQDKPEIEIQEENEGKKTRSNRK